MDAPKSTVESADERKLRAQLRSSEEKYRHELMDIEMRGELYDRIVKLRCKLGP